METFIYGDLKKACLNRDFSKVKTLGPYAKVIATIIDWAFMEKLNKNEKLNAKYKTKPVFRGMLIDEEIFNE